MRNSVRIALLLSILLCFPRPALTAPVELTTPSGPIRGILTDGIGIFKGIPYAKPPVGDLRFAPPEKAAPWTEVLDCENFGPTAVQRIPIGDLPMSEDCLTLNVWTPAKAGDGAKLPVYVFIHGGGFAQGSGAEPAYDGMNFARSGIVTITINYRLNALGFYATQETLDRYGTTGNWGHMDQIAALEWVRDNVAAFGGDPAKVTIGGESAGSYSVSGLLLSPLAKDLFRGAIMESGTVLSAAGNTAYVKGDLKRAIEMANMMSRLFGAADNAEGLAKLRAADPNPFAQMSPLEVDFTKIPAFFCLSIYDGKVLPKDPLKVLNEGNFNRVKLLYGFNADEGSLFIPAEKDKLQYEALAVKILGYDRAQTFLKRFPVDADHSATQRARQIQAFGMFTTDMTVYGDIFSKNGLDVYAYHFEYVAPGNPGGLGAAHGSELPYVFKNPKLDPFDAEQATLAENMHIQWANFIKNGDPNVGDTPPSSVPWPKYDGRSAQVMRFDRSISAGTLPGKADLEFMRDLMFGENPYYKVDNGTREKNDSSGGGCYVGTAGIVALLALGVFIATRRKRA